MGFIPAKCTQCGANIEVDESKEAGICKYCGTAFVTEKAINNYNTYITNNINVIHQDNPDYICPKCQSSDTKALKLIKKPPSFVSHQNSFYGFLILSGMLLFISIFDIATDHFNYISVVLLALSGMATYGYHLMDRDNYQKYLKDFSIWEKSYQCMRCGKIFSIKSK